MRALTVLVLSVVAFACGKSPVPDAGVVDAGEVVAAPVCLPDWVDGGTSIDGGPLDFSCRGQAPAPGGQAVLVVAGKATRAGFVRNPVSGVLVELLQLDGTVLASTLSGDGGTYELTFDAGCYPLDGEVRATHPQQDAGFYVSHSVPAAPWRLDRSGLELVLFDSSSRGLAAGIAGVTIIEGTAVLALTVDDCAGNPVEGALVSTVGGVGVVRYVGASGLPSAMQLATAPSGQAVIFNLPVPSVEVIVTLDGGVIGQRVVPLHADSPSGTVITP